MVFQTVVLIKLLIQDVCQLKQSVKIILLENECSSTKMHGKKSSRCNVGTVGILTVFLPPIKYYVVLSYKNEF